jgi:hypothetical protein
MAFAELRLFALVREAMALEMHSPEMYLVGRRSCVARGRITMMRHVDPVYSHGADPKLGKEFGLSDVGLATSTWHRVTVLVVIRITRT